MTFALLMLALAAVLAASLLVRERIVRPRRLHLTPPRAMPQTGRGRHRLRRRARAH